MKRETVRVIDKQNKAENSHGRRSIAVLQIKLLKTLAPETKKNIK